MVSRTGVLSTGFLIASCGLVTVGCLGGGGIDPLAIRENESGELELVTTCGASISADVAEAANEVRIDEIHGDAVDGDCEGVLRLRLGAPIGDRDVIVEGERWVDLPATCPWGAIGPSTLGDRLASCTSTSD